MIKKLYWMCAGNPHSRQFTERDTIAQVSARWTHKTGEETLWFCFQTRWNQVLFLNKDSKGGRLQYVAQIGLQDFLQMCALC